MINDMSTASYTRCRKMAQEIERKREALHLAGINGPIYNDGCRAIGELARALEALIKAGEAGV